MNNLDISLRRAIKLPCLQISTARSTSAKLRNASTNQSSTMEDLTPYFKHSRNQSNSMEPNIIHNDISMLCQRILQEQSILKQKINEQEQFIRKICKRRPPVHHSIEPVVSKNQENQEITFKPKMWPESARNCQRFKFPREVFTRKVKTRQS